MAQKASSPATEEELRQSHELLLAALNHSLSAIMIARAPDGRIELANPAALSMRGGSPEKLTGIAIEDHSERWQTFRMDGSPYPADELPLSRAILQGETSEGQEVIIRDQTGKDHIVVANASPVRGSDGSTIAGIVVFHDVTGEREALRAAEKANEELHALRQKLEEHLQELEDRVARRTAELAAKNEELEAFSSSISHDLRAPLRAIQGWTRALREDHAEQLSAEARGLIGRQEDAAMRMMEMIEDLLRLSRLSKHPLRLRSWDPAQTIREVWQLAVAADPAGARARLTLGENLPICNADPALMRQVIGNVLENALKFSRQRKEIQIKINGWRQENECIYSIEDNGIGFEEAYAERIFQPFQRLHSQRTYEGTGIGLATVKRIITRHGGRLWAHSRPGEGSSFFFALPVQATGGMST